LPDGLGRRASGCGNAHSVLAERLPLIRQFFLQQADIRHDDKKPPHHGGGKWQTGQNVFG